MPGLDAFDRSRLGLVVDETRQHLDHDGKVLQPLTKDVEVLLGENSGGSQQRDLLAAHRSLERGAQRELRFAEAHVTAKQPVHGTVRLHISLDLGERRQLVRRLFIRK